MKFAVSRSDGKRKLRRRKSKVCAVRRSPRNKRLGSRRPQTAMKLRQKLQNRHFISAAKSKEDPDRLAEAIITGYFKTASDLILLSSKSLSLRQCLFTLRQLTLVHLLAYSKADTFPTRILEDLIDAGCDPNTKDGLNRTLLHLMIINRRWDDLERCIHLLKGSVNDLNEEGRSPLHEAALRKSLRAVNILLEAGASLNSKSRKNGVTALQYAVLLDAEDVVKRLLEEKDIDVNAIADGGFTALDLAIENEYYILQGLLKSHGAVSRIEDDEDEDHEMEEEEAIVETAITDDEEDETGGHPTTNCRRLEAKSGEVLVN